MPPAQFGSKRKIIGMSDDTTATQELILQPIYCPHTGKRIMAEKYKQFDIPNGRVTWFRCEACQGWHIVIDNVDPSEFLRHISQD
jgi:hypothetical protein